MQALARYEKALGPEHTLTLFIMNNLGILYQDQGKLKNVEDMYVRALAECKKGLGLEHINTVMV